MSKSTPSPLSDTSDLAIEHQDAASAAVPVDPDQLAANIPESDIPVPENPSAEAPGALHDQQPEHSASWGPWLGAAILVVGLGGFAWHWHTSGADTMVTPSPAASSPVPETMARPANDVQYPQTTVRGQGPAAPQAQAPAPARAPVNPPVTGAAPGVAVGQAGQLPAPPYPTTGTLPDRPDPTTVQAAPPGAEPLIVPPGEPQGQAPVAIPNIPPPELPRHVRQVTPSLKAAAQDGRAYIAKLTDTPGQKAALARLSDALGYALVLDLNNEQEVLAAAQALAEATACLNSAYPSGGSAERVTRLRAAVLSTPERREAFTMYSSTPASGKLLQPVTGTCQ